MRPRAPSARSGRKPALALSLFLAMLVASIFPPLLLSDLQDAVAQSSDNALGFYPSCQYGDVEASPPAVQGMCEPVSAPSGTTEFIAETYPGNGTISSTATLHLFGYGVGTVSSIATTLVDTTTGQTLAEGMSIINTNLSGTSCAQASTVPTITATVSTSPGDQVAYADGIELTFSFTFASSTGSFTFCTGGDTASVLLAQPGTNETSTSSSTTVLSTTSTNSTTRAAPTSSGLSPRVWILVGLIVIAIILGGLFFFLNARKKKDCTPEQVAEEQARCDQACSDAKKSLAAFQQQWDELKQEADYIQNTLLRDYNDEVADFNDDSNSYLQDQARFVGSNSEADARDDSPDTKAIASEYQQLESDFDKINSDANELSQRITELNANVNALRAKVSDMIAQLKALKFNCGVTCPALAAIIAALSALLNLLAVFNMQVPGSPSMPQPPTVTPGGDVGVDVQPPPKTREKVRVRIVSPGDLTIWVCNKPVTFVAETIPAGLEQFIEWETPGEQDQTMRHGYGPTFTETWTQTVVAQVTAEISPMQGAKGPDPKPADGDGSKDDLLLYLYGSNLTGSSDSLRTVLESDDPNNQKNPYQYSWDRDHAYPFSSVPLQLSLPDKASDFDANDVLGIFKDIGTTALRAGAKDGNITGLVTLEHFGPLPDYFPTRAALHANIAGVLSSAAKAAGQDAATDLLKQVNEKLLLPLQQQATAKYGNGSEVFDLQAIQQDLAKLFTQLGNYLGDVLQNATNNLLDTPVCGTPVRKWLQIDIAIGDKSDEAAEMVKQSGAKPFDLQIVEEGEGAGKGGGSQGGPTVKQAGLSPQAESTLAAINQKLVDLEKAQNEKGIQVNFKLFAPKASFHIDINKLAELKEPDGFIKKLSYAPNVEMSMNQDGILGKLGLSPSVTEDLAKGAQGWKDLGTGSKLDKGLSSGVTGSATLSTDQTKRTVFSLNFNFGLNYDFSGHKMTETGGLGIKFEW